MILMNPHQIRETQAILSLPFFVQINQVALNKLLEIFAYENVCGVTGNTINDNVKEIVALKDLCRRTIFPLNPSRLPTSGKISKRTVTAWYPLSYRITGHRKF
jgi:hypothetical protein